MADGSLERLRADAADGLVRIGPGRLVMVVGPSGAGKDSLIRAARAALAGDARFVFPRRFVTRPASASEDNAEITLPVFETLRLANGFSACWTAHGLGYGLPRSIDREIAAGRTVICNVSRTVVAALRGRYRATLVVEVTAPEEVLAARLAARARAGDGSHHQRVARAAVLADSVRADRVISNGGTLAAAEADFLAILRESLCTPLIAAPPEPELPAPVQEPTNCRGSGADE